MGWRELRKAIADDNSDTASYSDELSSVEVLQRKGFMCTLKAKGKVHLEPDKVFDILVSPDTDRIFTGIKKVDYRKTLEDDGAGRLKTEVQQVGQWKFLGFSGQFTTRLHVSQDKIARTIDFRLAKQGWMKDFAGKWTIQPLNEHDSKHSPAGGPGLPNMNPFASRPKSSLITLEQSILPGFIPPKPLDRVLKGISSRQVQIILQDLQNEVQRHQLQQDGSSPVVVPHGQDSHQHQGKQRRPSSGPFDFGWNTK